MSYPHPIVIATPNENPSKTEIGIRVQYFSSFRAYTINKNTPDTIATNGTIWTPFSYTSPFIILTKAPAGPKIL